MRFRWLLGVVLILSGCASAPSLPSAPAYSNVHPGNTTWAMIDGSWAEYDYLSYTGTFNPIDGTVTITSGSVVQVGGARFTNLPYHMPNDPAQIAEARVQTNVGVPAVTVDPTLAYVLLERQSQYVIGEAANPGAASQDPPEPYLTVNPVAGEALDISSLITKFDGTTFQFQSRYQTIAVGVDYDGFPNATVTTLIENPGTTLITSYEFVFSDGEIAEEIIGRVNADNTITSGNLIKRLRVGRN